jgi:hypothetical protein
MAKVIKTVLNIQHEGIEVTDKQIIDKIKKDWVASGKLVKDITSLDIYVKPSENMVYYVIDGNTYDLSISDILAE